ncbi:MAG: DUF4465 domain-containing protein, partial [Flavobacteriales bacterium]|nr:DUF4465 domain-containing protein [Flavobacteriales bacterium]
MKKTLLIAAMASVTMANAQSIEGTFENPALVSADTSWFGQDQVTDGDTIYYNDNFNMELSYNADWGSFSGWSVSNTSDVTTPGWTNQFSAITGEGHSSDQYGVCYVTPWNNNRLFYEEEETPTFGGMYVTNTTYAYLSMLNGDSFAKKFGEDTSATGVIDGTNGEDWFLLTIYGLGLDSLPTGDSVNFYLADYRFENDGDDYIVDSWEYVDLTSLGSVHGLDFVLTSSDTAGGFGMNTPAYFAMDDINAGWASIEEEEMVQLSAFPNPFNDQ